MKPTIPQGTRDFNPQQVIRRRYIINIIEETYKKYGFMPIETPSFENLTTLTGKYGEEGDQLLFKILRNGDFLQKVKTPDDYKKMAFEICEKGLRYDLTVPFARYVVMHQNEITFPFKRYQIQPVWRGDRPQKGRYQEFYQCDADVVGSNALINEVELLQIIDEVYTRLNLKVVIKINNRKLLAALSEVAQIPEKLIDMTVAIDKLDKIGLEGVVKELEKREFSGFAIDTITQVLACKTIPELERLLGDNEQGKLGIAEMNEILAMVNLAPLNNVLELDFTLARGLSYYTGTIIEVKAADVVMGSLNGGGRYDNLTGLFGLPNLSGVGISFGLDRVYDVLDELNLFPSDAEQNVKLLFVSFDKTTYLHAFQLLQQARKKGISAELYPDSSKIKKQMQYANDRQIPFVAIVGEEEVTNNQITLKNMLEGSQSKVSIEELILHLG